MIMDTAPVNGRIAHKALQYIYEGISIDNELSSKACAPLHVQYIAGCVYWCYIAALVCMLNETGARVTQEEQHT